MGEAQAKYRLTVIDGTAAPLRAVEANFKKHLGNIGSYGKTLSLGLTAPIVAFGVTALKTAADFETSMNRVEGVTGASAAEMAKLNAQAKALGASTSFSASEAGDAMGYLAQAGFNANQIIGAMPSTLQLAEASQMDLAAAADITSNILAGYGKQVTDLVHINDVLVKAADATNTDIAGLGEAMAYVAPVASGMGLAFEETVGALGLLSNAGIKGSMAGTTLREALGSLANPSVEAAAVLKQLGVQAFDSKGKMVPLADIIGRLQMQGMTAGEALTIFGQRAGPGMLALVKQGAGALRDLQGELDNSGGAAEHMAAVQMKGLNGAIKNLQSAFEGLQIALTESGLLTWITNFVTRVAGWLTAAISASDGTKRLALTIAGLAAAAGPAMMLVGKLVGLISFMTSPIGWVITAIGLLSLAWARWGDDIKKIVAPVTDWLKDKFDEVAGFILAMVSGILYDLSVLFNTLAKLPGKIGQDMGAARDALKGWSESLWQTREALIAADDGASAWDAMVKRIKDGSKALMDQLKALGGTVPDVAAGVDNLAASTGNLGNQAQGTGSVLFSWIGELQRVVPLWAQMARGVGLAQDQLNSVGWASKASAKMMKSAFADAAEGLADSFGDAVFRAQNLLEGLANAARSVMSSLLSGLMKLGLAKIFPSLAPAWGFVAPKSSMTGNHLKAGQASWVGENGRELWVPDTAGTVVPSGQVSGPQSVTIPVTINYTGRDINDPIEFRKLANRLQSELEKIARTFYDPKTARAGA